MSQKQTSPDALSILSAHFDALQPRRVEVAGLPFPLFFKPLTPEQAFKLVKGMNQENGGKKAMAYAELMVETVTLESGEPAFPLVKGGPNPVLALTTKIPPRVFGDLSNALIDGVNQTAVEEVEKK